MNNERTKNGWQVYKAEAQGAAERAPESRIQEIEQLASGVWELAGLADTRRALASIKTHSWQ